MFQWGGVCVGLCVCVCEPPRPPPKNQPPEQTWWETRRKKGRWRWVGSNYLALVLSNNEINEI